MNDQWFGKTFWLTLGALAGGFLLSLAVFHNVGEGIFLAVVGLGIIALTVWRLEYGLLAAFAELFANSHGHLVSTEIGGFDLSLREVVFLAVMVGWVVYIIRQKIKDTKFCVPTTIIKNPIWIYFLPIIIAVAIGYIVGFKENEAGKAFNDGNAYFYLAYLFPILSVKWDSIKQRQLLQVFAAAAIWVTILTLGLLYEFTHFPAWMLSRSYTFIRDTRTGELTRMTDSVFRIFLQAQFSTIIFAFLLAPWLWLKELDKKSKGRLLLILSCLAGTILIGLSRSFWVGILAGLVLFIFLLIKMVKPGIKLLAGSAGLGVVSGIIGGVILVLIILFPLPYRMSSPGELSALFSSRTSELGDVAISSRWNLLPEMWEEVIAAPIIGSGFGEEVTFKTDDPRARTISPDGAWTTYTFEWGWLDLWLKMGILGPLAFLWLFFGLLKGLLADVVRLERNPSEALAKADKSRPAWLTIGLVSGLFMLYATHVFSPYLNHPLGLGFLLFIVPFIKTETVLIPFRLPTVVIMERPTSLATTVGAPVQKILS